MPDDIDRSILDILRRDGRASVSDIARRVGLSPAPVSRRIERLEATGVIRGYRAIVDDQRAGEILAFTQISLAGNTVTDEMEEVVRDIAEVEAFYTIAGDPDVVLRLRVDDVDHLQRVVNSLRRTGAVASTKTLLVLYAWER